MSEQLPPALDHVAQLLGRFPGVGQRSALRLAFHLLRRPREESAQLADALSVLHDSVGFCSQCGHLSGAELCEICNDPRRDPSLVCVVEGVPDLLAIEATGEFGGHYHVLHGILSPLRGVGPSSLRIAELVERAGQGHIEELILATPISVEGEATAAYIKSLLTRTPDLLLSRIASGVPQGSELEYIDQGTLGRALKARTTL
ncbi:MAG: recombination protein RecR [Myxococcales bacterium]|nr:recombination protein RecR [Myxococcales bacterium]